MLGQEHDVTRALAVVVIGFVVVFGGAYYYLSVSISPMSSPFPPSSSGPPTSSPSGKGPTASTYAPPGSSSSTLSAGSVTCGSGTISGALMVGMAGGPGVPFSPQNVTLVVGRNNTITWTNNDPKAIPHTVTSNAGLFDSGILTGPFTCTFNAAGTYYYRCYLHPAMVGTIIVKSQ